MDVCVCEWVGRLCVNVEEMKGCEGKQVGGLGPKKTGASEK